MNGLHQVLGVGAWLNRQPLEYRERFLTRLDHQTRVARILTWVLGSVLVVLSIAVILSPR
jgi:hypothetical protein